MELIKKSINSNLPDGTVRIKLSAVKAADRYDHRQFVDIYSSDGEIIWKGKSGDTAVLYLNGPTAVKIRYCPSSLEYIGECTEIIDPSKCRDYCVLAKEGFFSTLLTIHSSETFERN